VVEVRVEERGDHYASRSLGWSTFDLFNEHMQIDSGYWKLPLFPPPVDFGLVTSELFAQQKP
jgi:hypothetical protein